MAGFNLIQAPEILSRLTRKLGLRQMHIAPTLNEGVQAVVLLDDVSDPLDTQKPVFLGRAIGVGVLAGNAAAGAIWNPPGSGVRVQLLTIWAASGQGADDLRVALLPGAAANPITTPVAGIAFSEDLGRPAVPASAAGLWGGNYATGNTYHWIYQELVGHSSPLLAPRALYIHSGQAVVVFCQRATVTTLPVAFEWSEEPDPGPQNLG